MKTKALTLLLLGACASNDTGTDSADAAPSADAAQVYDAGPPDGASSCALASVSPEDGATAVSLYPFVILGFTCCLDSTSVSGIRLSDQAGETTYTPHVQEDDCTSLTMSGSKDLESLTVHKISIPGGLSGIRGREGETMADDFESTFTTGP